MRHLCLAIAAILALSGPALSCGTPAELSALRAEALAAVNATRARSGLAPLAAHPKLDKAAQTHACDLARRGTLSHTGSDGSTFGARIHRTGYLRGTANENIATRTGGGTATVGAWMNSPPHRKNILAGRTREAGIGVALSASGHSFWVMVTASRG